MLYNLNIILTYYFNIQAYYFQNKIFVFESWMGTEKYIVVTLGFKNNTYYFNHTMYSVLTTIPASPPFSMFTFLDVCICLVNEFAKASYICETVNALK